MVLSFLIDEGDVIVRTYDKGVFKEADFEAEIRSVQRYLRRHELRRGKRHGAVSINSAHIAARNEYLRILLENRMQTLRLRIREVFHQHHRSDTFNIYYEGDADNNGKAPHKGQRFCFVAAIA